MEASAPRLHWRNIKTPLKTSLYKETYISEYISRGNVLILSIRQQNTENYKRM